MITCLETWTFGTNCLLLGREILFLLIIVLSKQQLCQLFYFGVGIPLLMSKIFHQRFRFDIVLFPVILSLIVLVVIYLHAKVGTRVYFSYLLKESSYNMAVTSFVCNVIPDCINLGTMNFTYQRHLCFSY
jgi:hypothetical protein